MKKMFIFLVSLVVATIVAQAIIAVTAVIFFMTGLPTIVVGVMLIFGISFGIFCGILSFKKIFRSLRKELQNI
jgi:ABC-type antimicrobial peptide transport system permease subunit